MLNEDQKIAVLGMAIDLATRAYNDNSLPTQTLRRRVEASQSGDAKDMLAGLVAHYFAHLNGLVEAEQGASPGGADE